MSEQIFTGIASILYRIVSTVALPSHKFNQNLANNDSKRSIELYCIFTAPDSIVDANNI